MSDPIFPEGIFVSLPHEKAPEWIKLTLGIKVEETIPFLQKHANDRGYVNLDLKKSKEGKLYLQLNDYKKGGQKPSIDENDINAKLQNAREDDDIPVIENDDPGEL